MDNFQIQDVLESMVVLVDTRERPTDHSQKRYEQFGVPYRRQKLNYGDYSYSFTCNGLERYHPNESDIKPLCVIERKADLVELSQCFCQSRKRFEAEFERAKSCGASIYLLVEDASWEKILHGKYDTKYNSAAFTASMVAWMIRYDIKPIFCQSEISGKLIKEILYRDLKERLERGEFDWVLDG